MLGYWQVAAVAVRGPGAMTIKYGPVSRREWRRGVQSDISGTATFYGGGGGGRRSGPNEGAGGRGGGGDGYVTTQHFSHLTSRCTQTQAVGGRRRQEWHDYYYGGSGGSGVVILRYQSAPTTCSDAGDAAEGGEIAVHLRRRRRAPSAEDKKKQAETTRDSILADISDARVKAKAKLLADAAIAGVKVQRLSAKITAADEDTACSETFSKAGMSAGDGACVATAASSGKRRSLSAMAYDVELMFSASTVNDDALKAAELELKNNGVEGVTSQTSVDPIAELKTVPGVDTSKLQTFETEASAAATAAEAQTPRRPRLRPRRSLTSYWTTTMEPRRRPRAGRELPRLTSYWIQHQVSTALPWFSARGSRQPNSHPSLFDPGLTRLLTISSNADSSDRSTPTLYIAFPVVIGVCVVLLVLFYRRRVTVVEVHVDPTRVTDIKLHVVDKGRKGGPVDGHRVCDSRDVNL